ncbi:hypothetical protein CQA57_06990 [Helicobacter anseris]|uniref:Uncharacterized protein n=1 Tax=Helicobacter anseris TaxID=375926 RepID=A0A3D8J6A6_9HELI|nr:hypothetical protein [Helicobacter anseris]RDU72341.1 hypothetical protein CQA57_06990 [Helicobacter anseris]
MKKVIFFAIFLTSLNAGAGDNFKIILDMIGVLNDNKDKYDFEFDLDGNENALDNTGINSYRLEANSAVDSLNPEEIFNNSTQNFNNSLNKFKENAK